MNKIYTTEIVYDKYFESLQDKINEKIAQWNDTRGYYVSDVQYSNKDNQEGYISALIVISSF